MKKIIYDITPFTLIDFPEKVACILWFSGCNMRCLYCYNTDIVFSKEGKYTEKEIIEFLESRKGLLDGVVFCGGEPTIYKEDIFSLSKRIKEMNFLIKMDTNGSNPHIIKELIDKSLIDYIALDFKAPKSKFKDITKSNFFDNFIKTLRIIISSNIESEIRTTIHSDLFNEDDINEIILTLYKEGYKGKFYLQKFLYTENNIGKLPKEKKKYKS